MNYSPLENIGNQRVINRVWKILILLLTTSLGIPKRTEVSTVYLDMPRISKLRTISQVIDNCHFISKFGLATTLLLTNRVIEYLPHRKFEYFGVFSFTYQIRGCFLAFVLQMCIIVVMIFQYETKQWVPLANWVLLAWEGGEAPLVG